MVLDGRGRVVAAVVRLGNKLWLFESLLVSSQCKADTGLSGQGADVLERRSLLRVGHNLERRNLSLLTLPSSVAAS
ncbi:hypothetical protein Tco_0574159 [Tanacetum coccineum]